MRFQTPKLKGRLPSRIWKKWIMEILLERRILVYYLKINIHETTVFFLSNFILAHVYWYPHLWTRIAHSSSLVTHGNMPLFPSMSSFVRLQRYNDHTTNSKFKRIRVSFSTIFFQITRQSIVTTDNIGLYKPFIWTYVLTVLYQPAQYCLHEEIRFEKSKCIDCIRWLNISFRKKYLKD